jgi:hypothetical protein
MTPEQIKAHIKDRQRKKYEREVEKAGGIEAFREQRAEYRRKYRAEGRDRGVTPAQAKPDAAGGVYCPCCGVALKVVAK